MDSLLQPFVSQVQSYIRNTSDFITKVENKPVPENALLISLDVTSLYTNIPVDEARDVVQFYLEKETYKGTPVQFILQLVDLLLEKNYFKYENYFFFQTKGVSVGSSFSPSLAILFMAQLEDKCILNKSQNPFWASIFLYWRFIDDIFCVSHILNVCLSSWNG